MSIPSAHEIPLDYKVEISNGTRADFNLFPILPTTVRDARYQTFPRVRVNPTIISLGTHFGSAPSYHSKGWTISVHPEGKRYANIRTPEGISVVTEAHVTDSPVADQIGSYLAVVRDLAAKKNVHIPETSDLFLEIDQNSGSCYYWFADHANRTVFWLHPVDTIIVGLPNSCSEGHRQYSLEENYWTHVEMFPATASQYSLTALEQLQIILLNARADTLTSDVPTFPYTGEECESYLDLLKSSKEHASNPYITAFVARLWVIVANHRFFTHFGEDHCRLSSVHSVLQAPDRKKSIILTAISKVLFDLPDQHRERLEQIWVDDLVYASAWRKHVSERIGDLKLKMIWIFGLMIANILIMPISYCPALNKSSILLCILGLVITLVLFQEQRKLENTGATTGAAYLDTRNTSYGFQSTAMVHSLPQVAFIWASSLFTLQGFGLVFGDLPTGILLRTLIPIAVVLVVACYGIWVALHPRERPFRDFSLPESAPFLDSPTDQKDPSIVDGIV